VDVVRAGGAFLVVLAHVVLYPSLKGTGPLWVQSLYYTATRAAVPLFFMASGYLLLRKQETLGDFFRKRALRVFIPFLIWSFVYLAWEGGFSGKPFTLMSILLGLARILRGPRAAHLWFFYVLIGLYLVTPTLRLFTAQARDRDLLYFCGMWLFLDPILSLIKYLTGQLVGFEFQFFTGYIGYYVLGFYLGRLVPTRALVMAGLGILAAATAFVFVTVYVGQQQPNYDQFYEGYLSLFVVLMTASAFMLIRRFAGAISAVALRWISALSSASLGIYLLHVIVLDLMDAQLAPLLPILRTGSSIWVMPAVGVAGFLVCFLIVGLLQRLPVVKYAVP
jgi:surface polysaccharide O-acyltransferase-like enzyme